MEMVQECFLQKLHDLQKLELLLLLIETSLSWVEDPLMSAQSQC